MTIKSEYTDLTTVKAGVNQGGVLVSLLYLLYPPNLPTSAESTTATFADDTTIIIFHLSFISNQNLVHSLS
jgi:hypothetical protein